MFKNLFKKTQPVPEPYVEIIETTHDPEHGFKFKLDWNDEFVEYLKENGYSGDTDELIVEKWMQNICDSNDPRLGT